MSTKSWYKARDIVFSYEQMPWLLENLPLLRDGRWPPDPRPTGYVDPGITTHNRPHHANFETPCQIAAEVDVRLSMLGLDRYLLEDFYVNHKDEVQLAGELQLEIQVIRRRLNSALWYITGWRRKRITYADWKTHGRKDAKKRLFVYPHLTTGT